MQAHSLLYRSAAVCTGTHSQYHIQQEQTGVVVLPNRAARFSRHKLNQHGGQQQQARCSTTRDTPFKRYTPVEATNHDLALTVDDQNCRDAHGSADTSPLCLRVPPLPGSRLVLSKVDGISQGPMRQQTTGQQGQNNAGGTQDAE